MRKALTVRPERFFFPQRQFILSAEKRRAYVWSRYKSKDAKKYLCANLRTARELFRAKSLLRIRRISNFKFQISNLKGTDLIHGQSSINARASGAKALLFRSPMSRLKPRPTMSV